MIEKCKRVLIDAPSIVDYQSYGNPSAKKVILLLHGYGQNSDDIQESFKDLLINSDYHWIIPNGVFPIPKKRKDHISYRFAWYFYNNVKQEYYIDFDYPTHVLKGLLHQLNPTKRPVTVIGYSQGGYLAPFIAQAYDACEKIIGINCNYRYDMLSNELNFDLYSIHGDNDPIVDYQNSMESFKKLSDRTDTSQYFTAKDSTHDIDSQILDLVTKLI